MSWIEREKQVHLEIHDSSFTIIHEKYFYENDYKFSKMNSFISRNKHQVQGINFVNEDNYRAILFTCISSTIYSLSTLIAKFISMHYVNVENASVNLIRGIVIMILCQIYANNHNIHLWNEMNKPKKKIFILVLRTFFGSLCNFLLIESLHHMRISSAFTIFNIAPIITTILTVIFLNGKLNLLDGITFITCFFSVVIITKPGFLFDSNSQQEDKFIGIIISIFACLASGIAVFFNRMISADFHFITSSYFMGLFFFIISILVIPFTENGIITLTFFPFILSILFSIFFFFSYSIFVYALSIGDPIKILPVTYLGVVLNLFYNTFIFRQHIDLLDVLGSFLIIFINIYKTLKG